MDQKNIRVERETDSRGKQIMYDIFSTQHKIPIKVKPHTHTYFELTFVEEGVATDSCGDAPVFVNAGEVFFVAPNAVHDLCPSVQFGEYRSTVVKFSPFFLYPLNATPSDVTGLFTPPRFEAPTFLFRNGSNEARELSSLIKEINSEQQGKHPNYEMALRAHLTVLYLYLTRRLTVALQNPYQMDPLFSDSSMNIKNALSYMEKNFSQNISMQEVADQVGMSYYKFSRAFLHMTGKKFSEYLSDIRLSHAKHLLLKDGKTASDVAIECGFDYLSYFIGKFKKAYGITPHEFQQKYRFQKES